MKPEPADILISWDTTGSMMPALTQVRREVDKTVKELFENIPDLRMALITHGDYCDGPQIINIQDFTTNQKSLCDFIKNAPATSGGDSPEAYEYVLNKARYLSWDKNRSKALILIGDDIPHSKSDYQNKQKLDWKAEAEALVSHGVNIYAVQALGRKYAESFYQSLADISSTPKLDLAQFGQVPELLQAICYKQSNKLSEFEALLRAKATESIDISLLTNLDRLSGKKSSAKPKKRSDGLVPVHPSRFQRLSVDGSYKIPIKNFVQDNGLTFKTGRGFYEFTKTEEVQENKEVVLVDKYNGDMFSGAAARNIIGLPFGTRGKVAPNKFNKDWKIFIQSTSNNRALMPGTDFLYEVDDIG